MPTTPEDLFRRLDQLGIESVTHEHPAVFTVEGSAALRNRLPGAHCKNLYLRDKEKRNWLVVAPAEKPFDLKELQQRLGSDRLSFGSAERLMQFLGVEPGAVTPFALINDGAGQVTLGAG